MKRLYVPTQPSSLSPPWQRAGQDVPPPLRRILPRLFRTAGPAITAMLAYIAVLAGVSSAHAEQPKPPSGYVLYRVMVVVPGPKQPYVLEATPEGGQCRAEIKYSKSCTERPTFSWKFGKDIRFLRLGESFNVTLTAGLSGGNCNIDRAAFITGSGSKGTFSRALKKLPKSEADEFGQDTIGDTGRLYDNPKAKNLPTGATTGKIEVWKSSYAKRILFKVDMAGGSAVRGESLDVEVAYLYRAVYDAEPPRVNDDDITLDRPGERDSTNGTPSGGTNTPTPADPGGGTTGTGGRTPGQGGTDVTSGTPGRGPSDGGTSGGRTDGTNGGTTTTPGGSHGTPGGDTRFGRRTLRADRRIVQQSQRVMVPVYLLKPDGVANVNFTVQYDPSVIVPDGKVVKGSLLSAARMESNSNQSGLIRIGFAQTTPLARDGIVAYLPFRAVGQPGSKSPLRLAVSDIDDEAGNGLAIDLIDGEVVIDDGSQTVPGDCDCDGEITVADAICALKMSVNLMPANQNLDVNRDGKVTSADARKILQSIP